MVEKRKTKWLPGLLALLVVFVLASPAHAWWNGDWSHRKKVTFNLGPAGIAGSTEHVPLLVRLHSGNFTFTSAKDDGTDLRFVAGDDKTLLKHHFEKYDGLEEMALVWVDVPKLSATDNFIWLYYGNSNAAAAADPKGTYDASQVADYHFAEIKGSPQDATAYANNPSAFTGSLGTPGVVGNGAAFRGAGSKLVIPASPSLKFSSGFTFAAWVRIAGPQSDAYLFCREQKDSAIVVGIKQTTAYVRISAGPVPVLVTETKANLSPGAWHHLAVTIDASRHLAVYLDGAQTHTTDIPVALPDVSGDVVLAGAAGSEHSLAGQLDEVEIASTARPADWVKAAALSQKPEGGLVSLGQEEANEGGGALANIEIIAALRNMSLDGWAILGVIMLLGVASVAVFVNKSLTIYRMQKDNNSFMESFREQEDLLALHEQEEGFTNSSLYHIYQAGCDVLRAKFGNPDPASAKLSPKALNTFKAALEAEATRENQRLDRWVMVLTAAISGGPFLGLLGTVWGILNTFFAISLTGEASIIAIAPGIATALVNTVVGLFVAIPALFGYNYVCAKVKNATAEMYLFVDEFALKVDDTYGEGR